MSARASFGGVVYHALNRAIGRTAIFRTRADYLAFEGLLEEALGRFDMRVIDFCVMPNHWHFVLWPRLDGDLSRFLRWLTLTHAKRWRVAHDKVSEGALYQGRYRFFAVQSDHHLWTVRRYVMRNPVRANMVDSAAKWRPGSAWKRIHDPAWTRRFLDEGPLPLPRGWLELVDAEAATPEREALRPSLERGMPFGGEEWARSASVRQFGKAALRLPGRPRLETTS